MEDPVVQRLLNAEDQASKLVQELNNLKSESNSYRSARESLTIVSEGLNKLSSDLANLTEGISAGVVVMKEIGTPALLERLDALSHNLSKLESSLETIRIDSEGRDKKHQDNLLALKESAVNELAHINSRLKRILIIFGVALILTLAALGALVWSQFQSFFA